MAHGNLKETLSLVVALTNRQAAIRNITTSLDCPPNIALSTYLFFFESLIYLTLLALFQNSAEGSELSIEVLDESPNVTICIKLRDEDNLSITAYPDNDQKILADQLGASCHREKNMCTITLPAIVS